MADQAGARFRVKITLRDKSTGKAFDLSDYTAAAHFRLVPYDYTLPALWAADRKILLPGFIDRIRNCNTK